MSTETRLKALLDVEVQAKSSIQLFANLETNFKNINKLVDKLKGKLKDIGSVKIDADFTDLLKALKEINSELPKVQQYISSINLKPLTDQFGKLTASVDGLKDVTIKVDTPDLDAAKDKMEQIAKDANAVNAALKDLDVDINAQLNASTPSASKQTPVGSVDAAGAGAGIEKLVKILPEASKGMDKLGLAAIGFVGAFKEVDQHVEALPSKVQVTAEQSYNWSVKAIEKFKTDAEQLLAQIDEDSEHFGYYDVDNQANDKAALQEFVSVYDDVTKQLRELSPTAGWSDKIETARNALEGLKIPLEGGSKYARQFESEIDSLAEHMSKLAKAAPKQLVQPSKFAIIGIDEAIKQLQEVRGTSDEATEAIKQLALENATVSKVLLEGKGSVREYSETIRQLTAAALECATNGQEKLAEELANVGNKMKLELQYAQQLVAGNSAMTQSFKAMSGVFTSAVGGLQAIAGTFALFGASDKDIQKVIKDLLGLQAVINGLKQLSNFTSEWKKLNVAVSHWMGVSGKSMKSLLDTAKAAKGAEKATAAFAVAKKALAASAGPLVVALTAVIAVYKLLADRAREARAEAVAFEEQVRSMTKTTASLSVNMHELRDS